LQIVIVMSLNPQGWGKQFFGGTLHLIFNVTKFGHAISFLFEILDLCKTDVFSQFFEFEFCFNL
jgi:hypothetical protein